MTSKVIAAMSFTGSKDNSVNGGVSTPGSEKTSGGNTPSSERISGGNTPASERISGRGSFMSAFSPTGNVSNPNANPNGIIDAMSSPMTSESAGWCQNIPKFVINMYIITSFIYFCMICFKYSVNVGMQPPRGGHPYSSSPSPRGTFTRQAANQKIDIDSIAELSEAVRWCGEFERGNE